MDNGCVEFDGRDLIDDDLGGELDGTDDLAP